MLYYSFWIVWNNAFVGNWCKPSLSYRHKSPVTLTYGWMGSTSASVEKVIWPGAAVNNSFSAWKVTRDYTSSDYWNVSNWENSFSRLISLRKLEWWVLIWLGLNNFLNKTNSTSSNSTTYRETTIDPLHKWPLNLNNNTLYILSLVLMFSDKGFFTCMRG